MTGTFSSLSSALSALRYNRVAMDVASGNVANASTAGYARRSLIGQSTGAPAIPALWSRWEGAGDGVEASRVDRMVDPLLDARARTEHGSQSYLSTRASVLARFETSIGEPGDDGVAAALSSFKTGWHDLANNPDDVAARTQLLARASTLTATIGSQARALSSEWEDQHVHLESQVEEVNKIASDLADLNQGLRGANLTGTDAGGLLDQRDQLTLRLAELTGSTVTLNDDTTVEVRVGGRLLVDGNTAHSMSVSGSPGLAGVAADPVTISVDGTSVAVIGGEVGGTRALLDTDLPDYRDRLDAVVADLAGTVNTQHALGKDLDGLAGAGFFSGTTADTLAVAITDPRRIAAADPTKGTYDAGNAEALAGLDLGASGYRELVTRFGVEVASAQQVSRNQELLTTQVDASRESLSGINIDEEMVNLLAAQRGYEGAARVLTAVDSMLDTLINRTGAR